MPEVAASSIGQSAELTVISGLDSNFMEYTQSTRTLKIYYAKVKRKNLKQYALKVRITDDENVITEDMVYI